MKSPRALWLSFEAGVRRRVYLRRPAALVAFIVESAIAALLSAARVRFLHLNNPGRIGHLVADIAMFVKGRALGRIPRYIGVLISPHGVAANERLLDYWRDHVFVVRSAFCAHILSRLTRFRRAVHDASILALNETAPHIAIEREWRDRPPVLKLKSEDRRRGEAWLDARGVPRGARFVCFHSRESGYDRDDTHAFRNSDIQNYLPAVRELVERGFWCVRMGDPSMQRIPRMENVINYAHLDERSDWLDVFLCASCYFFLGSCSGLVSLAGVFGRPCAVANQAPLSHVQSFGIHDVVIPKRLWSEREGRVLTFREVLQSDVANFRYSRLFDERGIRLIENSGEEVRDLAFEMLERLDGGATYTSEDETLQDRLRALMHPGHYSYGGVNRVGRGFLRKYEDLL